MLWCAYAHAGALKCGECALVDSSVLWCTQVHSDVLWYTPVLLVAHFLLRCPAPEYSGVLRFIHA